MSEPVEAGHPDYRPTALVLSAGLRDQLAKHAESAYPGEACGALLGRSAGLDHSIVTRAIPLPNSDPSGRNGYQISPDDLEVTLSAADTREEVVLGYYHSHPDRPAHPSERDLQNGVPGLLYVAVSVRSGRAGARNAWLVDPAAPPSAASPSREGPCRN